MGRKDVDTIWSGLAYGGLGFGVLAAAAPRVFMKVYGLDTGADVRTMVQLWGTRTALISAIALSVTEPAARRRLGVGIVGLNIADSALVATAGSEVSVRTRILGAASSAAFAAAGGYWLSHQR